MKHSLGKFLSKAIIFSIFGFLTPVMVFLMILTRRKRWKILDSFLLCFSSHVFASSYLPLKNKNQTLYLISLPSLFSAMYFNESSFLLGRP